MLQDVQIILRGLCHRGFMHLLNTLANGPTPNPQSGELHAKITLLKVKHAALKRLQHSQVSKLRSAVTDRGRGAEGPSSSAASESSDNEGPSSAAARPRSHQKSPLAAQVCHERLFAIFYSCHFVPWFALHVSGCSWAEGFPIAVSWLSGCASLPFLTSMTLTIERQRQLSH